MKKNIGIIFSLILVIIFISSFINVNKVFAAVKCDDSSLLNAKVTPVITSISPLSAKIGDVITIKGENFQRLDYVTFNTVRTIVESCTATEIKVKVPVGATDGKITVMNFSNLSTVSSDIFRIITAEYIVFQYDITSVTMTSVLLKASGLMTSQAYQLSVYDRTAQAPFKVWTINSASDGTFQFKVEGLTAGHSYDASLDLNLDGNVTHKQIGFDTLIDKNAPVTPINTPTPVIQDNGSKIVPTCNTGEIDKVTGQYKNPCDFNYFMLLLNNLIKFVLFTIATPLVALIIMYTAYLFLTAGGSAGQTEKARHILFNVVIGYIVALAAWLVVNTIMTTLLDKNAEINTFLDKSSLQK
ncbi:MAG: IPT/TIG domain-containing protein [Candidatus Paceibacterota bacterium]